MKINFKKNSSAQLIIVSVVIFVVFIFIAFLALRSLSPSNNQVEIDALVDDVETPEPEAVLDIIDLKSQMPYYGNSFTIVFDENEGIFYAYIDPTSDTAGAQELDSFLQQNGISGRESFPGLEVVDYPLPTPEP